MAKIDIPELAEMQAKLDYLTRLVERAVITGPPEWYSIPDAAKKLGRTEDTIRRQIREGHLEARGAGASRQVRIAA